MQKKRKEFALGESFHGAGLGGMIARRQICSKTLLLFQHVQVSFSR
jgi:hypothetical protein